MAYGKNAVGTDGGRGIRARSEAVVDRNGYPSNAEGAIDATNMFSRDPGFLGQDQLEHTVDDDYPRNPPTQGPQNNPGNYQPGNIYPFQFSRDGGFLGQDAPEHTKDDDYPVTPNPDFRGDIPLPNAGQVGEPINFNAVAPYEYPEFPMSSSGSKDPTAFTGQPGSPSS